MVDIYTTRNSKVELKLKALDPTGLYSILARMGLSINSSRDEIENKLSDKTNDTERRQSIDAINQLFSFCMTRGIETVPQDNVIDDLRAMGFDSDNKNIMRMFWLRHLELEDQDEAGELVGLIIALSFASTRKQKEEFAT